MDGRGGGRKGHLMITKCKWMQIGLLHMRAVLQICLGFLFTFNRG